MGIFKDLFGGKEPSAPAEPATATPVAPETQTPPPPSPPPLAKPKPPKRQPQEDENMEGVQRLVARRVERLLELLGTVATRVRTGEELPAFTVTLHLAHGHTLTGEVVDYVPKEAVLLALGKEGLLRSASVAYADVNTIVAVSVTNAEKLLELPQLVRPIPTRQDLAQLAERLATSITEQFWPGELSLGGKGLRFDVDWVGLDDEPGRRALEGSINVTSHALRALATESGREVLRRITAVKFVKGPNARATRDGETGTVTVAPGSGEPTLTAFRKGLGAGL
ncbi:hypothetical protein JGU66_11010 [Myxococcaceae bacterium JPH2]|nr:hypothetical protein [Myxococcaceae bacterium JPH2]